MIKACQQVQRRAEPEARRIRRARAARLALEAAVQAASLAQVASHRFKVILRKPSRTSFHSRLRRLRRGLAGQAELLLERVEARAQGA